MKDLIKHILSQKKIEIKKEELSNQEDFCGKSKN